MNHRTLTAIAVLFFSLCWCPCRGVLGGEGKTRSLFMPRELRERVLANIRQDEGAARLRDQLVERARPWMELSDDQIWGLMFGPGITRSWMVWSDGHCPACGKTVLMYNWQMDAMSRPWKTWCPHCTPSSRPMTSRRSTRADSTNAASSTPPRPTARCCSTPRTPTPTTRCTGSAWTTESLKSRH